MVVGVERNVMFNRIEKVIKGKEAEEEVKRTLRGDDYEKVTDMLLSGGEWGEETKDAILGEVMRGLGRMWQARKEEKYTTVW
jgi:hypothetical protein